MVGFMRRHSRWPGPCPRCGNRNVARVKRGRISRIRRSEQIPQHLRIPGVPRDAEVDDRFWQAWKTEAKRRHHEWESNTPGIRVYWPIRRAGSKLLAWCPDCSPERRYPEEEPPVDPRIPTKRPKLEDANQKRKRKAREHKEAQAKWRK